MLISDYSEFMNRTLAVKLLSLPKKISVLSEWYQKVLECERKSSAFYSLRDFV